MNDWKTLKEECFACQLTFLTGIGDDAVCARRVGNDALDLGYDLLSTFRGYEHSIAPAS